SRLISDTDRTVENGEHYQKTTVLNVQAEQANMGDDEVMKKVVVKEDEFSGLIGNIAGNLIRDRVGGPGGDILAGLADNVLGGGGRGGYNNYDGGGGGGGFYGGGGQPQPPPSQPKSKGSKALDFLGGLIGGRKHDKTGNRGGGGFGGGGGGGYDDGGYGGGGGRPQGGGGFNLNDIGGST
ncbi:hypothetical protein GCK32_017230, partial [Trichostrongylus colubriformis]